MIKRSVRKGDLIASTIRSVGGMLDLNARSAPSSLPKTPLAGLQSDWQRLGADMRRATAKVKSSGDRR